MRKVLADFFIFFFHLFLLALDVVMTFLLFV